MDKNVIWEIQDTWEGGCNAGVHPKRVASNQCVEATNLQFRGGQPRPRPAWVLKPLTFLTGSPTAFRFAIWQGGCYYNIVDHDYYVAVLSGRVYVFEFFNNRTEVSDVTPDTGNNQSIPVCWLVQADKYVVIQDGERTPIVVMGKTAQRAFGVNPIPVGTVMCYVNFRLWVAIGNQILAGDLKGSEDDAALHFNEATYLNEGGSFSLPAAQGNVVSMNYIASQDTATGQGTLLIGGENGWSSINGLIPREQWKDTQIQQVTLVDIGSTGSRSVINVNGDLWFRAHDGWRTYRQARAEIAGWNQVPLSNPVRQHVDIELPAYFGYISGVFFDNRLIVTTRPAAKGGRPYHAGLLSLDFDPVSTGLGLSGTPAWDGLWTLPAAPVQLFTGIFQGRKRCFCACLSGFDNVIYEMTDDYKDSNAPIAWSLVSRRFSFNGRAGASKPGPHFKCKLVEGGDVRVSTQVGNSSLSIDYRQDDASNWKPWMTWSISGQPSVCATGPGCAIILPPEYYSSRLILADLPATVDALSNALDDLFYDAQFQLRGTGYLQLEWVRPQAVVISDNDQHAPV